MLKTQVMSPVVRAILVIGAVAALVTGVTFAALQSEATLTETTIAGGEALEVNGNPDEGETFAQTETGFQFVGVVPGVSSSQAEEFQIRNVSTTDVDVNVQITDHEGLPTGVDPTDVVFTFDPTDPDADSFTATWAELVVENGVSFATNLLGDDDDDGVGETRTYTVKVDVDGSVGESSFDVSAFTLMFGVPPEEPETT